MLVVSHEVTETYEQVRQMVRRFADIAAARSLVRRAAHLLDSGEAAGAACSMAKCYASDMAVRRTANAVQIFGGSRYIRGFEVKRLYRDAKITQIYGGTN